MGDIYEGFDGRVDNEKKLWTNRLSREYRVGYSRNAEGPDEETTRVRWKLGGVVEAGRETETAEHKA